MSPAENVVHLDGGHDCLAIEFTLHDHVNLDIDIEVFVVERFALGHDHAFVRPVAPDEVHDHLEGRRPRRHGWSIVLAVRPHPQRAQTELLYRLPPEITNWRRLTSPRPLPVRGRGAVKPFCRRSALRSPASRDERLPGRTLPIARAHVAQRGDGDPDARMAPQMTPSRLRRP